MMISSPFQDLIESIESLPVEDQDYLFDLIRKRRIENRRQEIAKNIIQSQQEYESGQVFRGTVDEVMRELNQ